MPYRPPTTPISYDEQPDDRGNVPDITRTTGSALHQEILKVWESSRPNPSELQARKDILRRVQRVVSSYGRHYEVACFGSTEARLDTSKSDLDICVVDKRHPDGFRLITADHLADIYSVDRLSSKLREEGFTNCRAISRARTPIVKFKDPSSGIDADVNVNGLAGVINTSLIISYCSLAPFTLRPLIYAVKRWARHNGLNDPSGRTQAASFSSYALELMCIAYLQAIDLLPNLQEEPLDGTHTHQTEVWTRNEGRADVRFRPVLCFSERDLERAAADGVESLPEEIAEAWRQRNDGRDLGELLRGFFLWYGEDDACQDAHQGDFWLWSECICAIHHSGIFLRDIHHPDQQVRWDSEPIVVQDPFLRKKNCTGAIRQVTADRIRKALQRASRLLREQTAVSFWDVCGRNN